MRIVVALGGNALLRRGEPMTADNQRINIRTATEQIAKIHPGNQLVIAHGNGPQVGLLSLQAAAYTSVTPYPLDVLGAETEGMIGYIIEQELGNLLDFEVPFATLLTQVEVDGNDPAFQKPSKPIGPVYSKSEAQKLAAEKGWSIAPDGDKFRRVVASPRPKRIFEIRPIKWLLEKGSIVICAGGGGIPTMYDADGKLQGVEAVIDKDLCSALLAEQLESDLLVIATDVAASGLHRPVPGLRRRKWRPPHHHRRPEGSRQGRGLHPHRHLGVHGRAGGSLGRAHRAIAALPGQCANDESLGQPAGEVHALPAGVP